MLHTERCRTWLRASRQKSIGRFCQDAGAGAVPALSGSFAAFLSSGSTSVRLLMLIGLLSVPLVPPSNGLRWPGRSGAGPYRRPAMTGSEQIEQALSTRYGPSTFSKAAVQHAQPTALVG